ncbi:6597_t:CDS:1 [Ambispora leptoticha]|uniref:6597_t:CDS:1 n=1 Tax=Ambispora leptoticha TaxID=144679 RepID=A0A9N9GGJ5_9GLOM|nr:6597_t:CDS:1 [Ambispora leptoticha]
MSNSKDNGREIMNPGEQKPEKSKDDELIEQLITLYYQQTLIYWDSTVRSTIENWISKNKYDLAHIIKLLEQQKELSAERACLLGFFYHYGVGFDARNYEEAFQLYKYAADKNDSFAYIQVGELYQTGIERDEEKAKEAYKRAALLGHPQGAYKYASFLPRKERIYWTRKSAEKGFSAAQREMAGHCHYGYGGVLKDEHCALKWILNYSKNSPVPVPQELMNLYFYYY